MKMVWRSWSVALSFAVLIVNAVKAEDFLYVVVSTNNGVTSEIHWIPAESPLSGRVLLEDLRSVRSVYHYRDELWWWPQASTKPKTSNLMGQDLVQVPFVSLQRNIERVRQGDMLYTLSSGQLEGVNLQTGEQRVLATHAFHSPGLAIYEDRLYFASSAGLDSVLIDGTDRRIEWEASDRGLFGNRRLAQNQTVHHERLYWVADGVLWQMELASKEVTVIVPQLPHALVDYAITDSAIYWIGDQTVWRRRHGEEADEKLYQFGDAPLLQLCAVTATRALARLPDQNHVVVDGEPHAHYQLLYSEDLRDWSPNFVESNLFGRFGTLRWLNPRQAAAEPLVWKISPAVPEAYFAAWKYEIGPPYDADKDDVPDYWERRYFGDLGASRDGDPDEDGLTNAEEVDLRTNPLSADTDEDGLNDGVEVSGEFWTSPAAMDTDGDGLEDGAEVLLHGTNPEASDSDGDGFTDGFEIAYDSEPGALESKPDREAVLLDQAEDLMAHFDFETSAQEGIPNLGVLGGYGRIFGDESSYVTRGENVETASRALDFQRNPDDSKNFSYLETDYRLEDLGMSGKGAAYTIALWFRSKKLHTGTLLSAARSESGDQAFILQVLGGTDSLRGRLQLSRRGALSRTILSSRSGVVAPAVWTHVVWTVGPRGRKFYVNGTALQADAALLHADGASALPAEGGLRTSPLEADPLLWIGARKERALATIPFHGAIDDVRIYRRQLSDGAVKLLAD